ncbi:hypothetical protein Pmar_PMAR026693 [Perkinsus marinus ATCC 50983]|uniref:Uncharacterized protein n=1 Tax=Perkinsus marinus (strain ATCC 50983 / TXsc) TaxID=423536 RepID=C5LWC7_PERM5|nr:hypothetical protein Pmar_PMAR026693 [Perkinsus marinus ATCC 50983]EEQ98969.1 hypothetical protein Pmar_PMAR026693 [Perkinsus marinus ATCC 50983]|eukprot:XP_002766252.1 hypothetical protein Pmar_PMAR026693 [Perkinsus marinus ATCC 50983]
MSSPANSSNSDGTPVDGQGPLGRGIRVDSQGLIMQPHMMASGSGPAPGGAGPVGTTLGLDTASGNPGATAAPYPGPLQKSAEVPEQSGLYPGSELILPPEVVSFIREKLMPTAQYDISSVLLYKNMGDCAELASSLRNPVNIYALSALSGLFGTEAKVSEAQPDPAVELMRQKFEKAYNVHVLSRYLPSAKIFAKIRKGEPVREDECGFSPVSAKMKRRMKCNADTDALRAVEGRPTEGQVSTLGALAEIAAAKAREKLKRSLNLPIGTPGPANSVDGKLLSILVERGPTVIDTVEETLRKEEAQGFIRKLNEGEILDRNRSFVPRGAIPKKDGGARKVVGVLVMSIPMSETSVPDDILFEILRNRPMSSKQWVGDIGAIHNLPSVQPNWDVLYLYANPTKRARVALYEKHKFIKILDKVEGDPVVYARYNA